MSDLKAENQWQLSCDCGLVNLCVSAQPHVRAFCHCRSCRELHNLSVLAAAAWKADDVTISQGEESLIDFKCPNKLMHRYVCRGCGMCLFNTNRFDFRVIQLPLFRKMNNDVLSENLMPDKHLFYADRVIDINDDLPKYLQGIDSEVIY